MYIFKTTKHINPKLKTQLCLIVGVDIACFIENYVVFRYSTTEAEIT